MAFVFNPQIMKQEAEFFSAQTSLYDKVNTVKYQIPCPEKEILKNQFYASKSTLLRTSSFHNEAATLEIIMRNCFKKCNKFVLEDWIDYDEIDCTLKCSALQKEAYQILKKADF